MSVKNIDHVTFLAGFVSSFQHSGLCAGGSGWNVGVQKLILSGNIFVISCILFHHIVEKFCSYVSILKGIQENYQFYKCSLFPYLIRCALFLL